MSTGESFRYGSKVLENERILFRRLAEGVFRSRRFVQLGRTNSPILLSLQAQPTILNLLKLVVAFGYSKWRQYRRVVCYLHDQMCSRAASC